MPNPSLRTVGLTLNAEDAEVSGAAEKNVNGYIFFL
jgi:hypothetical protein